jgi:L-threonylcarbamoyladenylate synthase
VVRLVSVVRLSFPLVSFLCDLWDEGLLRYLHCARLSHYDNFPSRAVPALRDAGSLWVSGVIVSAELLKVSADSPDPRFIRYAAGWLNRGSVVAIPTDTLYALAADPVNLAAVDEIFRVKGRPESKALPILINSIQHANILARELPDNFYRLADALWPGPLTIVLDASMRLPLKVTGNTRRIALRWPACEIVTRLIQELGVPLTGTSANVSGFPTCASGVEVFRQLGDRLPLILDAGETQALMPSTIVEIRGEHWCIGREGAIPSDVIHATLHSNGDGPSDEDPAVPA